MEGDEFHYHVLDLNESSTDDYMKKAYHPLTFQFQSDKNQYSQFSDVMQMMNKAQE